MRVTLAILLAMMASPSFAKDKIDCNNAGAQQEMNMCAQQEYEAADEELNAVWNKAKASAEEIDAQYEEASMKGAVEALLSAQRGWIAYRDGVCELSGWEAHGGSLEPMLVSGCLAEKTKARTKELQDFVQGPEQ